jgi:glycosyltransferase involved in cell wall biosynthesis
MSGLSRISIITVAYNSGSTINESMYSVLHQDYNDIEYILIDGKSSDNTYERMTEFKSINERKGFDIRIVSEKDNGIYDAMNKGIKLSTGDVIAILNSDDYYVDDLVISKVMNIYNKGNVDLIYGNIVFFDEYKDRRTWNAGTGDFRLGWNPPHPSTFISKKKYDEIGMYRTDYKLAADYDLLYRLMYMHQCKTYYLNEILVKMRLGGASTGGIQSNILGIKEIYNTLYEQNHKFKIIVIFLRLFRKIKQFKRSK